MIEHAPSRLAFPPRRPALPCGLRPRARLARDAGDRLRSLTRLRSCSCCASRRTTRPGSPSSSPTSSSRRCSSSAAPCSTSTRATRGRLGDRRRVGATSDHDAADLDAAAHASERGHGCYTSPQALGQTMKREAPAHGNPAGSTRTGVVHGRADLDDDGVGTGDAGGRWSRHVDGWATWPGWRRRRRGGPDASRQLSGSGRRRSSGGHGGKERRCRSTLCSRR